MAISAYSSKREGALEVNTEKSRLATRLSTSYPQPVRFVVPIFPVKKILFLTDSSQPASIPSARALQDLLEASAPSEIEVISSDPLALQTHPASPAITTRPDLSRNFVQSKLPKELANLLTYSQPQALVIFSPIYGSLLEPFWRRNPQIPRPDLYVALASTPDPEWPRLQPSFFAAASPFLKSFLEENGIPPQEIVVTGVPLSNVFNASTLRPPDLQTSGRPHLLVFLPRQRLHLAPFEHLLQKTEWDFTLVTSRLTKHIARARVLATIAPDRIRILPAPRAVQWPTLLLTHHLAIGAVPHALLPGLSAASCPAIVWTGEEVAESPAWHHLPSLNSGLLPRNQRLFIAWTERAFMHQGRLLKLWRKNLRDLHVENGAHNLANLILTRLKTEPAPTPEVVTVTPPEALVTPPPQPKSDSTNKQFLLCDFHSHTTWSDGVLSVRELVDFYGQRHFDCLCITDHLCDPKHLLGKLVNLTGLVIPPEELQEYFDEIEAEKQRALSRYGLLLLTGVEFNRDGYTPKSSTHLLGIDLKKPIDPSIPLKQLISEIRAQGALAVASHPLKMKSPWAKNTLYLWENQEEFAPLLDAWEIANRDDIFNPIGLKRLPILANSDFHKPPHIHSWKTVLHCEKNSESIKDCIRQNRDVFLSLYRSEELPGR